MTGFARAVAWSPDGRTIAAVGRDEILVYDAETLGEKKRIRGDEHAVALYMPPASAAFSPDGRILATAGFENRVTVWDTAGWQKLRVLNEAEGSTALVFAPDGKTLATAGQQTGIRVWDLQSAAPPAMLPSSSGALSLAISPDGKLLASGNVARRLQLWDLAEGGLIASLDEQPGPVLSVAFSPDGTLLASSTGGYEIRLWEIGKAGTPSEKRKIVDPQKPSPERAKTQMLASFLSFVGMVRTIQLTGAPGAMSPHIVPQEWPSFYCPVRFSPEGKYLAVIHYSPELAADYHLEVYEVATGERISRHSGLLSAIAFHPDGKRVASSGITRIVLVDPLSGEEAGR